MRGYIEMIGQEKLSNSCMYRIQGKVVSKLARRLNNRWIEKNGSGFEFNPFTGEIIEVFANAEKHDKTFRRGLV